MSVPLLELYKEHNSHRLAMLRTKLILGSISSRRTQLRDMTLLGVTFTLYEIDVVLVTFKLPFCFCYFACFCLFVHVSLTVLVKVDAKFAALNQERYLFIKPNAKYIVLQVCIEVLYLLVCR